MPHGPDELEQNLELRDELVEQLGSASRRVRQDAAHGLCQLAKRDASIVAGEADALVRALGRPEAQTRWECLDALAAVAAEDPQSVGAAFEGAEESLFDDTSSSARLAAFRFLASYGATSPERSREAWPLINEAVQCYHGDPEYRKMLLCLLDFAHGNVADDVRDELFKRMAYDAKNGRGFIRAYSTEIRSAAKGE